MLRDGGECTGGRRVRVDGPVMVRVMQKGEYTNQTSGISSVDLRLT